MKTESELPNKWSKRPPETIENRPGSSDGPILSKGAGTTRLDESNCSEGIDKRFEWNRGAFSGPIEGSEAKEKLLKTEERAVYGDDAMDDEDGVR